MGRTQEQASAGGHLVLEEEPGEAPGLGGELEDL